MLLLVAAALLFTSPGVWLLADHAIVAAAMLVVGGGALLRALTAPGRRSLGQSGPTAICWLADRLTGQPAPNSCTQPLPATPDPNW